VEKCLSCQFYDRRNSTQNDGKGTLWGQCRRTAPMLHPLNAKSYMVEGVWPHVRDDDWCGEWKMAARRSDVHTMDLMSVNPATQIPTSRPTALASLANVGATSAGGGATSASVLSRIGSD
jgi:hypothetical protein